VKTERISVRTGGTGAADMAAAAGDLVALRTYSCLLYYLPLFAAHAGAEWRRETPQGAIAVGCAARLVYAAGRACVAALVAHRADAGASAQLRTPAHGAVSATGDWRLLYFYSFIPRCLIYVAPL